MRSLKNVLAEQARAEKDERDLRSRSDERAERRAAEEALAELAWALVKLSDRQLGKLQLSEQLLDAVLEARSIPSARAKERAVRVVRRELREGNADEVAAELEAIEPRRARRTRRGGS